MRHRETFYLLAVLALALGCNRAKSDAAPAGSGSAPSPSTSAADAARSGEPWIAASGPCHRLRAFPLAGGTLVFAARSGGPSTRASSLFVIDDAGAVKDAGAGLPPYLEGAWMESVEVYGRWPSAYLVADNAGGAMEIYAHRGASWEMLPHHKALRGVAEWTLGRLITFDATLKLELVDGNLPPDLPKPPRPLFCAGYSHPWRSDVLVTDAAGDIFIAGGCPAFGGDPWGHNATKAALLILAKDGKPRWELPPGAGDKYPSGFGMKVLARSATDVFVGGMMVDRETPPYMMFDFYLAHFDGAAWKQIPAPTKESQMVLDLASDDDGSLWVSTGEGLFTWKDDRWTERPLPKIPGDPDAGSPKRLVPRTVARRGGALWIGAGTPGSGDGNGISDDGWIVRFGGPKRPLLRCDTRGAAPALVAEGAR